MSPLLAQLKKRRLKLGLKQNDMLLRVGISRQQFQRLESRGNPRLDTLELIARGLKSEIVLVPQDKLTAVKAILDGGEYADSASGRDTRHDRHESALANDPWKGLLDGDQ